MSSILRKLMKPLLGLTISASMLGLLEGTLWIAGIPPSGLYEGDLNTVWWLRADLDTTQRLPEEGLTFSVTTSDIGPYFSSPAG